jgi:hypothetical protein
VTEQTHHIIVPSYRYYRGGLWINCLNGMTACVHTRIFIDLITL